jgi:hypothetical protein
LKLVFDERWSTVEKKNFLKGRRTEKRGSGTSRKIKLGANDIV